SAGRALCHAAAEFQGTGSLPLQEGHRWRGAPKPRTGKVDGKDGHSLQTVMRRLHVPKITRSLLAAVARLWLVCSALAAAQAAPTNDTFFGFTGPETFPIDPFISDLRAADLDGDGLIDLVVVNNSRSKITLLYNQTGKTNLVTTRPDAKREINELPPGARFRIDSIASEKRIAALVVADLNGDQRPDIAYYGEPKELVVQYN